MATTQLSDAFIPAVYRDYQTEDTAVLTAFAQSGVAVNDAGITAEAMKGGQIGTVPFWKDLGNTDPNLSTDDPGTSASPEKITSGQMKYRVAALNKGFSSADLTAELAGSNPMQRIAARYDAYWARAFQRRLISSVKGVIADNIASDSGDMVLDVSIADGDAAVAANLFGRSNFTGAAFTMGDMFDGVTAVAVHSVVYKRMVDNDDIDFIKDSTGTMSIPTYLGKRVIVDDGMPVVAGGTSGFVYTSALFGAGVIGYGNGKVNVPVELEREAAQGNGGGVETLWERKSWIIQPFGYAWSDTSVAGVSPTLAECALAANWARVVERKNVPMAFLKTNG